MQQDHLAQIIKQKDKIIDRLNREKTLLSNKSRNEEQFKLRSVLEHLEKELKYQQQRVTYLKEENTFLETELRTKTEQYNGLYKQYEQLAASHRDFKKQSIKDIEELKAQIQTEKEKVKNEIVEIDSYGQIQQWKQKVYSQQEQLKYLRIQNQCLLMSK